MTLYKFFNYECSDEEIGEMVTYFLAILEDYLRFKKGYSICEIRRVKQKYCDMFFALPIEQQRSEIRGFFFKAIEVAQTQLGDSSQ